MTRKRSLYGAYKDVGKTSGSYRTSLYRVGDVESEKEHSRQMYELGEQERERNVGVISESISLASNLYGGVQSRKEFGEAKTEVQTGMAKTAYGKSEAGKIEGAPKWGELGEKGQSEWMGKFAPTEKPQAWHERLFGADKEIRFGQKVEGKEGKDLSKYYSKSDILAERLSSSALSLSKGTGSYEPTLSFKVGGLEDKPEVNDTGGFEGPPEPKGLKAQDKAKKMLDAGYKLPPGLGGSPIEEDLTMGQANKRFLEGGGQVGGAFDWRGKQYKSW